MIYHLDPIYDFLNLAKTEITQKWHSRVYSSHTKAEVNQNSGSQQLMTPVITPCSAREKGKLSWEKLPKEDPMLNQLVPCSDDQHVYQEQGVHTGRKGFDPLLFPKILHMLKTMKNSQKEIPQFNYFLLTS